MNSSLRLVIDTSVVVSAFRSKSGRSFDLIELIDQHRFVMLVTQALFLEYEAVLKRPEQRTVHGFTSTEIDDLLGEMLYHVERVSVIERVRGEAADPNDDLVLEAAVNGMADAIVTHNLRHLQRAAAGRGIAALTPGVIFKTGLLA